MTGVKRLDKVCNTTVFISVSSNELIYTVHDRQLSFLGHMLQNTCSPHASTYVLYELAHGTTRRGRPRLNYVNYIERLSEMRTDRLVKVSQDHEAWHELVVMCVDHNYTTRERQNYKWTEWEIIQKRRLTLFGHLVRMDESADARKILTAVPQSEWRRPVGRPYTSWMATLKNDLARHNLTLEDAIILALNKPLRRLLTASGATHWWCMPNNDDNE